MATALKNLSKYKDDDLPDGKEYKIGIAASLWNEKITQALYEGCYETLVKHGVREDNIHTAQVPGSFELPVAARMLLGAESLDAVVCIGCVIKGETRHDEYINNAVAQGITSVSLASGKPVIFCVLTPDTVQQAKDRAGGKHGNKGVEAAVTALRMIALKKELHTKKKKIGY